MERESVGSLPTSDCNTAMEGEEERGIGIVRPRAVVPVYIAKAGPIRDIWGFSVSTEAQPLQNWVTKLVAEFVRRD
jgi:hypothetical protein